MSTAEATDKCVLLAETVREYPHLYDPADDDYRNKWLRAETWEKIGLALNIDATKCKDKWERLRRSYARVLVRKGTNERKQIPETLPWRYEKYMKFLAPYIAEIRTRRSRGIETFDNTGSENFKDVIDSSPVKKDAREDAVKDAGNESVERNGIINSSNNKRDKEFSDLDDLCRDTLSSMNRKSNEYPATNGNAKPFESILNDRMPETVNIRRNFNVTVNDLDSTDLFFLSMARMTKELPKSTQISIRQCVSDVILKAQRDLL